jgi:peptidyl-tRNA hydrolase
LLRRKPRTGTPADALVVGLGNPGAEYAKSRHNVGAEVVELLAQRHGARLTKSKEGGGLAGHNGLRSIVAHLHTQDFVRVRIGVGKPVSKEHGADHVLKGFSKRDRAEIDVTIVEAADAVETIVTEGVDAAMTRFNRR